MAVSDLHTSRRLGGFVALHPPKQSDICTEMCVLSMASFTDAQDRSKLARFNVTQEHQGFDIPSPTPSSTQQQAGISAALHNMEEAQTNVCPPVVHTIFWKRQKCRVRREIRFAREQGGHLETPGLLLECPVCSANGRWQQLHQCGHEMTCVDYTGACVTVSFRGQLATA